MNTLRDLTKPYGWLKPGLFLGALVPLASLVRRALDHALGANPVAEALNQLGLLALIFLIASLTCTPLRILLHWNWPLRIRKMLGLFGFFYASLHLLTYAAIDQLGNVVAMVKDVVSRPFITVGFVAFLLLVPLAITSTAAMRKKLGGVRWQRLHRLAYLIALLGVIHFAWRVKKDVTEPAIYGTLLAALLAVRLIDAGKKSYAARPRDAS